VSALATPRGGILSGVRILDFTWKTVGPWEVRLLTHFGAEVIHVERVGSWDDHRYAGHPSPIIDGPQKEFTEGTGPLHGGGQADGKKLCLRAPVTQRLSVGDYVAVTATRGGATAAVGPFMLPTLRLPAAPLRLSGHLRV
jgi:hypothetical protein